MTRRAAISTHANQINAPLFRELARTNEHFQVLLLSETPPGQSVFDSEMQISFAWDVDTTSGYPGTTFPNARAQVLRPQLRDLRRVFRQTHQWIKKVNPHSVMLPAWNPIYATILPILRANNTSVVFRGVCRVPRARSALRLAVSDTAKRRFLSRVDVANYIGTHAREELLRLGFPTSRMVYSPYGIDNTSWATRVEEAPRQALREQLGVSEETTVFLLVNKLIDKKGLHHLLPAVQRASRHADLRVLIVGEGPLRSNLDLEIRRRDLTDIVHLVGFRNQTELGGYFAAADGFVLLSDDPAETWGLVLNEAMAAGLPVVASIDAGATCDLVSPGLTGFRIDPRRPQELTDAMIKISSKPIRSKMRKNSRLLVAAHGVVPAAAGVTRAFDMATARSH